MNNLEKAFLKGQFLDLVNLGFRMYNFGVSVDSVGLMVLEYS